MKIALVHDYIKEYGGAERVLEALHEIWPTSPVFTTVYLPEFLGPHRERFKDWDIRTSFLQYIPFKEKLISPFRIIAPFVFSASWRIDLSQFDVVIVSATGAYTPNTIKVKSQKSKVKTKSDLVKTITQNSKLSQQLRTNNKRPIHICYCHTPPRYLYGYATAREWKKNLIFRVFGEIGNHFLRLVDFRSAQSVDYFIANSKNVAGRIEKFYRKISTVIYPPVDVNSKFKIQNSKLQVKSQKEGYYLAGGRLARPKHIDLIVRACRELNVPLKVFGRGFAGYEQEVKSQKSKVKSTSKNSKVEFLGEVTDEKKLELMREAKAFISAAEDEDFGITPVEAMSVGTAVIAYRSGGVVESILQGQVLDSTWQGRTGLFFDELTVESLSKAIEQFNRVKRDNAINPTDCIKQAGKFSKERFKKEIKEFVESKLG